MAVNEGRPRRVLTSLSLEVTLYFGGWYDIFYCLATLVVYIYKGSELPYPDSNFRMEVAFLFLLALVEPCRLFLGSKGNKTERPGPLIFCILLSAPVIALHIFYIWGQTYVLKIDQVLSGIGLGFTCLQALIGIITVLTFNNNARQG
mmetsp:Transcript_20031/g.63755  ORF Transcript_20031/g.63755 Transcript_20031/m.63755 type:complete len:147 (-) Transcript_20031:13-453(-)